MGKTMDAFKSFFLERYASSSFMAQQKAKVFLWFEIAGLILIVVRASICSLIRWMPISAVMAEPARAVIIMAVSTGPSSMISERETSDPTAPAAPNCTRA